MCFRLSKEEVMLDSSLEFVIGQNDGKVRLLYSRIIVCDCEETGSCNSLYPVSGEDGVQYATCVCSDGFTGVKCEEKEKPCGSVEI